MIDGSAQLIVSEVDPVTLDERGSVDGVIRSGSNLSWVDGASITPVGKLNLHGSSYDGSGLIRIALQDKQGHSSVLGTFFVVGGSLTWGKGAWSGDLDLEAAQCALADDLWEFDYMAPAGSLATDIIAECCEHSMVHLEIAPNAGNAVVPVAQVWAAGESVLSTAQAMAEAMGCEIKAAPEGGVLLAPRTLPLAIEQGVRLTTVGDIRVEQEQAPGRVVARISCSGDEVAISYADAPPQSPASPSKRGRRVTLLVEPDAGSPSAEGAYFAASQALGEADEPPTYSFTCLYSDVRPGDIALVHVGDQDVSVKVAELDMDLAPGLLMDVKAVGL